MQYPCVTLLDTCSRFAVRPQQTILQAAIEAGIDLPSGCENGLCGTCKALCVDGAPRLLPYKDRALSASELAQGYILACRALVDADCSLSVRAATGAALPVLRRMQATIVAIDDPAPGVRRLRLRPESGEPFPFRPGQFAALTFAGLPARNYSFAGQPEDPELEFHIAREPGGQVSTHVHEQASPGDPVGVFGPLGHAYLRETDQRPILALASGTGLAPVKSIVERALACAPTRRIDLYIGARTSAHFYLLDHFGALAERSAALSVHRIVREPHAGDSAARTGTIAQALRGDGVRTSGRCVYAAGSPAMVDVCIQAAIELGAADDDCHADAFHDQTHFRSMSNDTIGQP